MRENFLHYIWKYKKFKLLNLRTTCGKSIEVISVGTHNHNSGPDFFNARIRIDNQLWAGNVEIHVRASDWYKHEHHVDSNYDSVVLHVVFENDSLAKRTDNSTIPTLQLKSHVSLSLLNNYERLLTNHKQFIACEKSFVEVDEYIVHSWLERLFIERLEDKVNFIEDILERSKHDWESTLFRLLAMGFGLKINSEAFISMAQSISFSVIRKLRTKQTDLEALFFGQSQLLKVDIDDPYFAQLKDIYQYQKIKYQLSNETVITTKFLRLRPISFPTIRLSQLATLYNKEEHLCAKVISCDSLDEFYDLFKVSASVFWDSHYTFGSESKEKQKQLSKAFINVLLINVVLPFKLSYAKYQNTSIEDSLLALASELGSERNNIIFKYNELKQVSHNAMHSQGLLQLYNNYCEKRKCLQCSIGNSLLSQ